MKKILILTMLFISLMTYSQNVTNGIKLGVVSDLNHDLNNTELGFDVGVIVNRIQLSGAFIVKDMGSENYTFFNVDLGYLFPVAKLDIAPVIGVSFDKYNETEHMYFGTMLAYNIAEEAALYVKSTTNHWVSLGIILKIN